MAFTPILLLVIILFVIFVFVKKTTKKATFINTSSIKFIFAGYIIILIISVVISYLIPIEDKGDERRNISMEEAEEIVNQFYEARNHGNFSDIEGVFIADEWSFDFHEDVLHLKALQDGLSGMWLLVERKATDDGKLDIIRYSTPQIVQGFDVTHLGVSPKLQLREGTLGVVRPERNRVRLATFHKEFTITQFTGETMFNDNHFGTGGVSVLYLKVPPHVQIYSDENIYFDEVTP